MYNFANPGRQIPFGTLTFSRLFDRAIGRTAATHRRCDESRVYSSHATIATNPIYLHLGHVAQVDGAVAGPPKSFLNSNLQSRAGRFGGTMATWAHCFRLGKTGENS
jgi:hypothetical protein